VSTPVSPGDSDRGDEKSCTTGEHFGDDFLFDITQPASFKERGPALINGEEFFGLCRTSDIKLAKVALLVI
jgi:hypothetical protein